MSLWVDTHRPTSLSKLDYHDRLSKQLVRLAASGDMPHMMFFGPPGAGKKTRIMCLLREMYGPGIEKMRIEHKTLTTPSGKKIEISTIASNYHIEVNPSDAGNNDYTVVRELLKEAAQAHTIDIGQSKSFKAVIISGADELTKSAQHALRRIMEKYTASCRYILCCTNSSKVIGAIRSRCLGVRLSAPTKDEIMKVLQVVAKKEGLRVPDELVARVADQSKRNLRRALLMLETCRVQQSHFSADQEVPLCDWELYIQETANIALKDQSPAKLLEVRGRLYELLTHCIPPEVVLKELARELIESLDTKLKVEVTRHAAEYEHRMQFGAKPIFHLEAFVAKFMSIYKRFLNDMDFF
eukprot:m.340181 g.340181  ORF g.340181 m.340181 type:complete len:354 (-) comp19169_c0_seq1:154-1215(-)